MVQYSQYPYGPPPSTTPPPMQYEPHSTQKPYGYSPPQSPEPYGYPSQPAQPAPQAPYGYSPPPSPTPYAQPPMYGGPPPQISYGPADSPPPSTSANIIVFGATGAGKSSVINMLAGAEVAKISNGAIGCTFETNIYRIHKPDDNITLNLFDTAGLNEGAEGTVQSSAAITNLYTLVRNLEGGIHLLVYVVRGPRIKESTSNNYRMFYEAFCQKKVPIVLVVTGLENVEPMDKWWEENAGAFRKYKMTFHGQACVTATKGKYIARANCYTFEDEYEQSKSKLANVVTEQYSVDPFKMESVGWMKLILKCMYNGVTPIIPGVRPKALAKSLYEAFVHGGMDRDRAVKTSNAFEIDLIRHPERHKEAEDVEIVEVTQGLGVPGVKRGISPGGHHKRLKFW